MLSESEVYAELDRLNAIDPKSQEIEAIIYALDWVLERIEDIEV